MYEPSQWHATSQRKSQKEIMYFNAIEKDGKLHITGRVSARF
jgi:hypothetical protein